MAEFRADHAGLAQILKGPELRNAARAAAIEVATEVRAQGSRVGNGRPLSVELREEADTDRAAIPHAAGVGMEARHGVLRRTAEAVGPGPARPAR